MAPRRRPRKPRLTRMDAAIDAMGQIGFPEDLVRRTVKELLKVYGGHEAWPFVEGDAYKLLIETILDGQEKHEEENSDEEQHLLKDDLSHDGRTDDNNMTDTAGPSNVVLVPTLCDAEDTALQNMEIEPVEDQSITPTCSEAVDKALQHVEIEQGLNPTFPEQDLFVPLKSDRNGCKNSDLNGNCTEEEVIGVIGSNDSKSKGKMHIESTHRLHSPPPLISSPPPLDSVPTRRRKPCYGWISSDEDEDFDDFIEFTPYTDFTPSTNGL